MTGRDLIIYILKNNLENEDIFSNGDFLHLPSSEELASKLNVGQATVEAYISMGVLDGLTFNDNVYILPNAKYFVLMERFEKFNN